MLVQVHSLHRPVSPRRVRRSLLVLFDSPAAANLPSHSSIPQKLFAPIHHLRLPPCECWKASNEKRVGKEAVLEYGQSQWQGKGFDGGQLGDDGLCTACSVFGLVAW